MTETEPEQRFVALYDEHFRRLLGYALRRVTPPEDAADVVAETFVIAWRRRADVPADPEARLWLYGVARRVIANQRRGSRRRERLGDRLGSHLVSVLPSRFEDRSDESVLVRDALDRLDPDDRELLTLTAWEGLRPHEIAVVVGVPAATIRTRLHRARGRLRDALADVGQDDVPTDTNAGATSGHVVGDGRLLVGEPERCNER